jgi:hypothetical protein
MKSIFFSFRSRPGRASRHVFSMLVLLSFWCRPAQASIFKGEALDTAADVLTWIVLIVAPIIGILVFLLIHILPEKIAEKRHHPQAKAIQCLCLLSLFFGGLLWPLAWLWAYSKPVLHKLAYGTDKEVPEPERSDPPAGKDEAEQLNELYDRVAELETKLARKADAPESKA